MKRGPVIAIDGPSGVGKSTLSRLLARHLGFIYIDTGAMYRAVALRAFELDIDMKNDDDETLKEFCLRLKLNYEDNKGLARICVDNIDYTDKIRSGRAARLASISSSKCPVRDALVRFQRGLGRDGGVVIEGRDIGTVVFPDADIKFYLDASPEIRAKRRFSQIKRSGKEVKLKDIIKVEQERDMRDSSRAISPLCKAKDAICIDTSRFSVQEVFESMLAFVEATLDIAKEGIKTGYIAC